MNFSEIANEMLDELDDTYEYDSLGEIAYCQTITDIANYAFEKWEVAIFVAFEAVIEEEMVKRGHLPNE